MEWGKGGREGYCPTPNTPVPFPFSTLRDGKRGAIGVSAGHTSPPSARLKGGSLPPSHPPGKGYIQRISQWGRRERWISALPPEMACFVFLPHLTIATVSPRWCRRRRRAFSFSASLPLLRKLLPAGLGLSLSLSLIAPLLVPSPLLCPPPSPRDIKYSRPSRKNAFLPPFLLRERMIPPSYPILHTARKKGCPSP